MLDVGFADTTIPRVKGNLGASWEGGMGRQPGNYVGRVPNWANDAWTPASWRFRQRALRHQRPLPGVADRQQPARQDAAEGRVWESYPYYDTAWFDSMGRSYYVQLTYKFGGKAAVNAAPRQYRKREAPACRGFFFIAGQRLPTLCRGQSFGWITSWLRP